MSSYKITVIVPALDEEANLPSCVDNIVASLGRVGVSGELIIINDGSSDKTGNLAEKCSFRHPFIRVIHHAFPQGIGASFWEGVQKARGEIVVMIPGDGENDAAEILQYLPLMEEVDIVIPFVSDPEVRTRKRRLLSYLYRRIINATSGLPVRNVTGTVMYRKAILKDISLKSRGFFYQSELLIKTAALGYLYKEVPYFLKRRIGGTSKSTTLKSLMDIVRSYLSVMIDIHFRMKDAGKALSGSKTAARRKDTT